MRILVIGRGFPDSADPTFGIFELNQARALAKAGHDVVYGFADGRIITRVRSFRPVAFDDPSSTVQVRGQRLPLKGAPWPIVRRMRSAALRRIVDTASTAMGAVDVVYAHYPAITLTAPFIRSLRRRDIPLVALEHWTRISDGTIPRKRKDAALATAEHAYRYCAVTPALANAVQKLVGNALAHPVDIVPNIVEPPPRQKPSETLAGSQLTGQGFRVVAIGRQVSVKRFDLVLHAIALLPADLKRTTTLTLIGDGPERPRLERLTSELGIRQHVTFAGRIAHEDVWPQLDQSDCYVTASPLETFGVPVAEAWAAGLHCVAPDNNPLRPHFTAENGTLFAVDDPEALAAALETAHGKLATINREQVSQEALNRYSSDSVVSQLTRLFEGAAARR